MRAQLVPQRGPPLHRSSGSTYCGHTLLLSRAGTLRPRARAPAAQPARASILGVGAPEAVLVGVVALVLFGPKGLAQAAKSVGATLKAFAPTIRELTQVSSDLKNTLEEEIGLNDLREEFQRPSVPTPRPASSTSASDAAPGAAPADGGGASLSELTASMQAAGGASASDVDPDIERKREEAAAMAWGGGGGGGGRAVVAAAPPLESMSVQELEAELARRKGVPQQLSADD